MARDLLHMRQHPLRPTDSQSAQKVEIELALSIGLVPLKHFTPILVYPLFGKRQRHIVVQEH